MPTIKNEITEKMLQTAGLFVKQIVYKWYGVSIGDPNGYRRDFADGKIRSILELLNELP